MFSTAPTALKVAPADPAEQEERKDNGAAPLLAAIEARLFEAVRTLTFLPDRERAYLQDLRSFWPATVRDPWEEFSVAVARGRYAAIKVKPPAPTPAAIDRMLPTLSWLGWLDEDGRKLVWLRAFGISWWRIAAKMGRSERTAQRRYEQALNIIAARLAISRGRARA
jgi:hypothetical protein